MRTKILTICIAICSIIACNEPIQLEQTPAKGFKSNAPAYDWSQSLLSGNGTMGAMVMGFPYSDTIIVNHALLYRPQNQPKRPVSQGENLEKIRSMMLKGDFQKASDFVIELSHKEGWGGKVWTDSYMPAFNLIIEQQTSSSNPDKYSRCVDFETGVADIKWSEGNDLYSRETFVSRADNLIVTRIKSNNDKNINCNITLKERIDLRHWWVGVDPRPSKETHGVTTKSEEDCIIYSSIFDNQIDGLIKGYQGVTKIICNGGKFENRNGIAHINGADEVLLLTRVVPYFNDTLFQDRALIDEINKLPSDYSRLLNAHKKIHGEIFNRVNIDLGGNSAESTLSSEELLASVEDCQYNPTLIEKQFYAARYHLLSATGINPPNLQGIWGGLTCAPWSGDYTTNGNLPVVVSSMLSSNMPELMLSTFNLMERYINDFETNAKVLFNCEGIHVPSRLSSHGLNNHFDAIWPMTFWTAGAAWYSMYYYDYYLHTGDIDFLQNRAMPFMEKSVKFYEDFLFKGANGKYIFAPSYSPENNPSNIPSQACVNATMDVMAANQLLRNCIAASKILGINKDKIEKWEEMLRDMPPYELNEKGELREWMWPGVEENHEHRHVSHLYGIYDMMDPIIKNSPELREGCKKVVEERMKIRRNDNGGVMVFGMQQLGCAASNLNDSENTFDILRWISAKYWNTNLFTNHDPGALFNCDLSGGIQQLLIKMLIYSEPGEVHILPAHPDEMQKGSISGVLLRGDIVLNNMSWSEEGVDFQITSSKDQNIALYFQKEMDLESGNAIMVTEKQFTTSLKADKASNFSFIYK